MCLRWKDRLRTFTSVATPDTVHVEGWANTGAFESSKSFFAFYFADAKVLFVRIKVEWRLVDCIAFCLSEFSNLVIESGNCNTAIFIVQGIDHTAQHINGICN